MAGVVYHTYPSDLERIMAGVIYLRDFYRMQARMIYHCNCIQFIFVVQHCSIRGVSIGGHFYYHRIYYVTVN